MNIKNYLVLLLSLICSSISIISSDKKISGHRPSSPIPSPAQQNRSWLTSCWCCGSKDTVIDLKAAARLRAQNFDSKPKDGIFSPKTTARIAQLRGQSKAEKAQKAALSGKNQADQVARELQSTAKLKDPVVQIVLKKKSAPLNFEDFDIDHSTSLPSSLLPGEVKFNHQHTQTGKPQVKGLQYLPRIQEVSRNNSFSSDVSSPTLKPTIGNTSPTTRMSDRTTKKLNAGLSSDEKTSEA